MQIPTLATAGDIAAAITIELYDRKHVYAGLAELCFGSFGYPQLAKQFPEFEQSEPLTSLESVVPMIKGPFYDIESSRNACVVAFGNNFGLQLPELDVNMGTRFLGGSGGLEVQPWNQFQAID